MKHKIEVRVLYVPPDRMDEEIEIYIDGNRLKNLKRIDNKCNPVDLEYATTHPWETKVSVTYEYED